MNFIIQNKKSKYINNVKQIMMDRSIEIFKFFNKNNQELNCNVYLYDRIESLVEGLKLRGFSNFPSYMCACFKDEDNSINYFEPKDNPKDNEWSKEEYESVIFHELVHAIEFNIYGTHPEWLSEGIAVTLDGTYSKGIKSLLENYVNKIYIPSQKEIEEEFGMHEYDSYDYAYLMVSYMIEINGKELFLEALDNKTLFDKIYSKNLLSDAIDYYNSKYKLLNPNLIEFSTDNYNVVKSRYLDDVLDMINDNEVSRYLYEKPPNKYYRNNLVKYMDSNINNNYYTILDKKSNEFVGNILIKETENKECEIGIAIKTSMQNKHCGQEILQKLSIFCFEKLKLNKINIYVFSFNKQAIHCYEKLGYIKNNVCEYANTIHMTLSRR